MKSGVHGLEIAYTPLDIGMIVVPSMRSIAYLWMMAEVGVAPKEIMLMAGTVPALQAFQAENERYRYHEFFFDPRFDMEQYMRACGTRVVSVDASTINDPQILRNVQESDVPMYLFTG